MNTNGHSDAFSAVPLERQVLGAALLDSSACATVVQLLTPEHLHDAKNQAVLRTIHDLFSKGSPVNAHSVAQAGKLDETYVTLLLTEVASFANVAWHGRIILERYIARASDRVVRKASARFREGGDVFEVLNEVQRDLSSFALGGTTDTHIRHGVAEALNRTDEWEEGEATDYTPTGFYSLDRTIGGYPIGELTTIAAMTGAGKTSILVQIARTLALIRKRKGAILLFSCEMSREQICHRAAAIHAGTNLRRLRSGRATKDEYDRHREALRLISSLPIYVDDTPSPTFTHISARCQQVAVTDGLWFVGVDYDEKIHSEGETEELRVSAIAQGLKNLAKRFSVAVVALSQYSRKATYTALPDDDHLRYSGKKEHESAVILHWFWPGYWVGKGKPEGAIVGFDKCGMDLGYLICTKNRFGSTGKITLRFEPEYTRFTDPGDPERTVDLAAKLRPIPIPDDSPF